MGFNRFQWWKHGMDVEVKPLKGKDHTLLDKIKHRDFDFSFSFIKALNQVDNEIEQITERVKMEYRGCSDLTLKENIRDETRMKNVRRIKLQEEMYEKEDAKLQLLRSELYNQFGFDLWDDLTDGDFNFDGGVLELYNLYKDRLHERWVPTASTN